MLEELPRYQKQVPIKGINFYMHNDDTFIITAQQALQVLGSAILGGELRRARAILNHTVALNYNGQYPERELRALADKLGLGKETVGMMTAVSVKHTFCKFARCKDLAVAAVCTVGIGNPGVAGMAVTDLKHKYQPGTINMILLVDGNFTEACAVNAVMTATEAKVRALFNAGIKLAGGEPVTGTTSDAIVVAGTGAGRPLRYAGTATDLGYLIGNTVYRAVSEGIYAYLRLSGKANWSQSGDGF